MTTLFYCGDVLCPTASASASVDVVTVSVATGGRERGGSGGSGEGAECTARPVKRSKIVRGGN